jgi:hypothetical protein
MPALVLHLQHSLRNPISKEEAERCVMLLAEKVERDWVRVVQIGRVKAVVLGGRRTH